MADTTDPNVAPTHDAVRSAFAPLYVFICGAAGAAAIVAGLILGLVLVND